MESDLLNEVACRLFDWRRFTKVARVQADLKYIWLQMLMLQQFCSLVAGYKYGNIEKIQEIILSLKIKHLVHGEPITIYFTYTWAVLWVFTQHAFDESSAEERKREQHIKMNQH